MLPMPFDITSGNIPIFHFLMSNSGKVKRFHVEQETDIIYYAILHLITVGFSRLFARVLMLINIYGSV